MLKKKLIMMFLTVAAVGSVSVKMIPMFSNDHTTIKKSQYSNIKGNYIKDVVVENARKYDVNKDMSLLFDEEESSNNSQYNDNTDNQEIISSKLEKPNNSDTNNQEIISSKLEKTNNGNTNNQKIISSKLEKSNNGNPNNQETISSKVEKTNNGNKNNQETISSKVEKPNNGNTNNQEIISSKLEKQNNNIDESTSTDFPLNNTNSSENIENQDSTNDTLEVEIPTIYYDRTTSIYANDNVTLLRVEYYKNNKLTYYSVIEQFDVTTKSYIEKIYQCNRETNVDPLIRTDIYVNGNLTKSY